MKTRAQIDDRFQNDAAKYASYLETPEGRLRLDLAFANLEEFLPSDKAPMRALDIGCGTGAMAIRLACLGTHVTLLDSSPAMLSIAERGALEAGVSDKITLKAGDAAQLGNIFQRGPFDLILCHNVLEYVDDPAVLVCDARCLLRNSSSLLSVLVRNQAGEVLKAAVQNGDLAAAENALTSEWAQESLYGGKVRLFPPETVRQLLKTASFRAIAERGVRVVADFLPPHVSRTGEFERILKLEYALGRRTEFATSARYTHTLACAVDPAENGL